jgi:hypothetical protein
MARIGKTPVLTAWRQLAYPGCEWQGGGGTKPLDGMFDPALLVPF